MTAIDTNRSISTLGIGGMAGGDVDFTVTLYHRLSCSLKLGINVIQFSPGFHRQLAAPWFTSVGGMVDVRSSKAEYAASSQGSACHRNPLAFNQAGQRYLRLGSNMEDHGKSCKEMLNRNISTSYLHSRHGQLPIPQTPSQDLRHC